MSKQSASNGFAPIIILIGILILVGIAGGGYYFFKTRTPAQKACTLEAKLCPDGSSVGRSGPNCEFALCPNPQTTGSAESANWKIYTNAKLNVSFNYPSNFTQREPSIDNQFGIYTAYFQRGDELLYFNADYGKAYKSIDDYLSNGYQASLYSYTEKKLVNIGNISWYIVKGIYNNGQEKFPSSTNITIKNGIAYSIGFSQEKEGSIEDDLVLGQILSSFKFLEGLQPSTSDETANWKIYAITPDSSLGYENYQIKLPNTWKQTEHSSNFQGTETFQDSQGIYKLSIVEQKNYNNQTGKPFASARELTGLSYDVITLTVDGQVAPRPLPRAGSEYIYKALFFSKDMKLTYSVTFETPSDGLKIQEGETLFNQILSTFKFLK